MTYECNCPQFASSAGGGGGVGGRGGELRELRELRDLDRREFCRALV